MSDAPLGPNTRISFSSSIIVILLIILLVILVARWVISPPKNKGNDTSPQSAIDHSFLLLGSFNNRYFYYETSQEDIWVCENGQCRPISGTRIPSVDSLSISPDQKKVALLTTKILERSGIYLFDLSAESGWKLNPVVEVKSLVVGDSFLQTSPLIWSPGSKQIAFIVNKNHKVDIAIAAVSLEQAQVTGQPKYLRTEGGSVGSIVWKNESSVAFISKLGGRDILYEVDTTGGNMVQIK